MPPTNRREAEKMEGKLDAEYDSLSSRMIIQRKLLNDSDKEAKEEGLKLMMLATKLVEMT